MGIHHTTIQLAPHDLPHPTKVVPFGIYGAGLWTGHPIGLAIGFALFFIRTLCERFSPLKGAA
jgi:hypothetical protein